MSVPFEVVFGRTLFRIRQSYDFSQAELASRAGISQAAVSQIENGSKSSSLETLRSLAASFDISASDLLAIVEEVSSSASRKDRILRDAITTLNKSEGWMSLEEAKRRFEHGGR